MGVGESTGSTAHSPRMGPTSSWEGQPLFVLWVGDPNPKVAQVPCTAHVSDVAVHAVVARGAEGALRCVREVERQAKRARWAWGSNRIATSTEPARRIEL